MRYRTNCILKNPSFSFFTILACLDYWMIGDERFDAYGIANLDIIKAKQQVKLDTTIAYFNLLQADSMLKVNQDSVNMLMEHLKNVKLQFAEGNIIKADILRSEVELADSEQKLIKAQNNCKIAIAGLDKMIGYSMDTEINPKEKLEYKKYDGSLEDKIKFAMSNRPEVLQANDKIDYAKQGIKIAKGGYLPTVAFQGMDNCYSDNFPGLNKNNNWSLALKIDVNVFDGGQTKADIEVANAQFEKNKQQANQTNDDIEFEVRQAYLDLKEAEKRIDTSQVAVEKAEEDIKIAQIRYSAGEGVNLDIIDAQVATVQAKANYIQSLYDFNTSKAKLEKAIGII